MLENGYVKVFRRLKKWGWYQDGPTKDVWLHILLSVNYEPQTFRGRQLERGQLITSYPSLALETGLSVQNVRTALRHLKQTGEITVQSTKAYSVITVPKFDDYQMEGSTAGGRLTGSSQTAGRQLTPMEESKKTKTQESKKEQRAQLPPEADNWFSQTLLAAIKDWLAYKQEQGEGYRQTGLQNLLSIIRSKAQAHSDAAVCEVIRLSMSNGWRGIIWDRLQDTSRKTGGTEPTGPLEDWEKQWQAEVKMRKAMRSARMQHDETEETTA